MDKATLSENLSGLVDLAEHKGVDVRPTLLRVLTDLYVQKNRHSEEEQRHYRELALRLIDLVDVPTRAIVAAKLAVYPAAPKAVIRRLARDVLAVAAPVLRQSTQLSNADLHDIAVDLGQGYAAVIATREDVDRVEPVPADMARAKLARAAQQIAVPPRTRMPAAEATSARELSELFFFSTSADRRLILLNLDFASAATSASVRRADADAIGRLEMAALARLPKQFADELAELLDVTRDQARRIVRDPLGEPAVVAAKAIDMPAEVLHRILLFLNPTIRLSVQRVYDLASLFDEITREAADMMVSIWREMNWREPKAPRAAANQPLHYDDEVGRLPQGATTMRPQAMPLPPARRSA